MALAVFLYAVNGLFLKRSVPPPLDLFFRCWFNDILAGLFLCAFLNFWLGLWRLRPVRSPWPLALLLLACGGVWEVATPLWKAGAVFDPLDLLAYLAGGGLYLLLSDTNMNRNIK